MAAIASMSRKGNAYDNAVVESFFANLKNELVHHRTFSTRDQARAEIQLKEYSLGTPTYRVG